MLRSWVQISQRETTNLPRDLKVPSRPYYIHDRVLKFEEFNTHLSQGFRERLRTITPVLSYLTMNRLHAKDLAMRVHTLFIDDMYSRFGWNERPPNCHMIFLPIVPIACIVKKEKNIYVRSGLTSVCISEQELVSHICHETGHYLHKNCDADNKIGAKELICEVTADLSAMLFLEKRPDIQSVEQYSRYAELSNIIAYEIFKYEKNLFDELILMNDLRNNKNVARYFRKTTKVYN